MLDPGKSVWVKLPAQDTLWAVGPNCHFHQVLFLGLLIWSVTCISGPACFFHSPKRALSSRATFHSHRRAEIRREVLFAPSLPCPTAHRSAAILHHDLHILGCSDSITANPTRAVQPVHWKPARLPASPTHHFQIGSLPVPRLFFFASRLI
jgi:hypothetical protein